MKKLTLFVLFVFLVRVTYGQEKNYTLEQCYRLALQNHPLSSQNALFEKSSQLQDKIYDENNLPQFNLNGQATYQSAVTELPIKVPGITVPEIPKDQYKVTLDASQVIYGGGTVESQKLLEKSSLEISKKGTEAELYRLRERISQVYFSVLLANYTLEVLKINKEELESRLLKVESGVRNGTLMPYNASVLQAEVLKVQQKLIESNSQKASFIKVLAVLTGNDIPADATFAEPAFTLDQAQYSNMRPEYSLFSLQQQKVAALKNLQATRMNPRVLAFADAGYGRPGLNMFKTTADLFYIVGAKVSWNFWNWHQTSQEMQLLDISSQVIENQKKTFDLNTRASIQQYITDISKTEALLKTDEQIINLQVEITAATSSQLDNGTITATDYLTQYNAEIQSRLLKNLHQVQWLQAKAGYLAATGNL